MSNPFSNVYKTVESYSFNTTHERTIDRMSESAAANSALRKMQAKEQENLEESQMWNEESRYQQNKLNEGIVNRYVRESQIPNNINRINEAAKNYVFKDILFEVFYNSLLMDDDFLKENCQSIKHLTDKYVDDNGGFEVLKNSIKDSVDDTLLKRIASVCESVAKEVCNRKLAESKDCKNIELIEFDINDDEEQMLDYSKKNDLDVERISQLVKDKVLTVVKDEKERQELDHELIENIENDLKTDENVTDEDSLNEAMNKIVLNKAVIENSTLFNALFRDSYEEIIKENVAIVSADKDNIDDHHEMSRNYDIDTDEDDVLHDEEPVEDREVNMDLVLTEAITKYTLMETLYTLGLESYTYDNIRKLTERMLNPVIESVITETEDFSKHRGEFFGIFNKLKDEPDSDTQRDKMNTFMSKMNSDKETKDECKGFITIAKKQIDDIIEKNPKMKDKYTELSEFIDNCGNTK